MYPSFVPDETNPDRILRLAEYLDRFMYDFDTYEYWDSVDDTEENVMQLARDISNGDLSIIAGLRANIREAAMDKRTEIVKDGRNLLRRLCRLEQYKNTVNKKML